MTKLIFWIRIHKGPLLILVGVSILLFVFYIDTLRLAGDPLSNPAFTTVYDGSQNREIVNELEVVAFTPSEGTSVKSFDPYFPITISFSGPIDPESVKLSIVPYLEYSVRVGTETPTEAVLIPKLRGWEPHLEYVVKVMGAKGTDGAVLLKNPSYRFKNTPPILDYRELPY